MTSLSEAEKTKSIKTNLRIAKLIMVTANNSNKFYNMTENTDDTFTVTFGKIGTYGTTRTYNMDQWKTKKKEKIRQGYTDTTQLFLSNFNERAEQQRKS